MFAPGSEELGLRQSHLLQGPAYPCPVQHCGTELPLAAYRGLESGQLWGFGPQSPTTWHVFCLCDPCRVLFTVGSEDLSRPYCSTRHWDHGNTLPFTDVIY
jgi:hypothetical protein